MKHPALLIDNMPASCTIALVVSRWKKITFIKAKELCPTQTHCPVVRLRDVLMLRHSKHNQNVYIVILHLRENPSCHELYVWCSKVVIIADHSFPAVFQEFHFASLPGSGDGVMICNLGLATGSALLARTKLCTMPACCARLLYGMRCRVLSGFSACSCACKIMTGIL